MVTLLFSEITNGALLPSASLKLQDIHLVRRLTHICQRHFALRRTLVISPPSNYRDAQQGLTADIQRTAIWPVVVTVDGKVNIPEESVFKDRDGSWFIFIPDGNIDSLHAEISGPIVDKKKFTNLWISEVRFVVARANEFSTSQQTDIFDYLSKFRIYNYIIVSRDIMKWTKNTADR